MVQKLPFHSIILFFSLIATSCLLIFFFLYKESYQPLHSLWQIESPSFNDDLDRASLIECTHRHISFLKKLDPEKLITFGPDTYSNSWLLHSVETFLEKLKQNPTITELRGFLSDNYLVYQAGGRKDQGRRRMLVTGYYEPIFEGNLTQEAPFLTPIYTPPPSLVTLSGENGERQIGRYNHDHQLTAYWSREEIETNAGLLQNNELVFLKDPFDAFLLHVQGSGRIQFPDKSIRTVRFAASNGLEYKSIGKLLVDEKIMALDEVTIPAIRSYLRQHPEQQQRILRHNPRYIFFNWGRDELDPKGSSGEVLTPGRSIAIDGSALPQGSLGYLVSRAPIAGEDGQIAGWKPLTRFVFPQDSGAAIKGTGRVDVFFGRGKDAEFAANHIKEKGKLYFLVKKQP
ncbi:MAG: MltA domain-containing protein [Pseudomonadota bacterium]